MKHNKCSLAFDAAVCERSRVTITKISDAVQQNQSAG